jgi:hypothetical protein
MDQPVARDRFAELLTLRGISDRGIQARLRDADATGGHRHGGRDW